MSRPNRRGALHATLALVAAAGAAGAGGCATDGEVSGSVGVSYGYGVYYGSAWGDDNWYGGGSIDVGPPNTPPPSTRPERPPHVSHQPARPLPPSRPAGGGGRRR